MVTISSDRWERIGQALDTNRDKGGRVRLCDGLEELKDAVLEADKGCECANKVIAVLDIVDREAAGRAREAKRASEQ